MAQQSIPVEELVAKVESYETRQSIPTYVLLWNVTGNDEFLAAQRQLVADRVTAIHVEIPQ